MSRGDSWVVSVVAIAVLVGVVLLIQHLTQPTRWTAFWSHPALSTAQTMDFDSKEACLEWIRDPYNRYGRYEIECGSNCRLDNIPLDLYRCDETLD